MAEHYRADHVGSLLRPPAVLEARAAHAAGRISLDQLRDIEDKAILEALEMQRQAGIDVFTDGEYRRSWWSGAIAESVEGIIDDPDAVSPQAGKDRPVRRPMRRRRRLALGRRWWGRSCDKSAGSPPTNRGS